MSKQSQPTAEILFLDPSALLVLLPRSLRNRLVARNRASTVKLARIQMMLKKVSLSCLCRLDTEHGVENKCGTMKVILHGEETIDEGNNSVTVRK